MNEEINVNSQEYWDSILERDGLGVLRVDEPYKSVDIKQIKGKWARLDASINGIEPGTAAVMTNSPETARGVGTRSPSAFNSMEPYTDENGDYLGDTVWENLILAHTGTPKEAEIADRARGTICGLDDFGRPKGLKLPRKQREPGKEWRKRICRHILGEVAMGEGPAYSKYQPTPPPYATRDGGNGPLSIKDLPKPKYEWVWSSPDKWDDEEDDGYVPPAAEPVRMSPVVDTMTYPPGRGPYQISMIAQSNSDITG